MVPCGVYVYGMTVLSTIHLLKGKYPPPDAYQEIQNTFMIPGGEGANAAIVLQHLGLRTCLDGCYLGAETAQPLTEYFARYGIDCSLFQTHRDFPGWRDIVLCDGDSRTVFGWFGDFLFGGKKLWTDPNEEAIRSAQCVALDPFFPGASAVVSELCQKFHKPYVTIDCKADDPIAQGARALVISKEFLQREYPHADESKMFEEYRRTCPGLLIFTRGSRELWYTSGNVPVKTFSPFKIHVVDTLGAGDTFRAGIVYGLVQGMTESAMIRFASAAAAVSCTRFPSVFQPPNLSEVEALLSE
jgi:sugar/nucleoside kinase (ribokinase family)